MNPLLAVSPIDGRYTEESKKLAPFFSESALIQYRVFVEIAYFKLLMKTKGVAPRALTKSEVALLDEIAQPTLEDCICVQRIERIGYKGIPATNHDVKAVEYFIKLKIEQTTLQPLAHFIHFGLTSEDINNCAYALMIRDALEQVYIPHVEVVRAELDARAHTYAGLPFLSRTHGQTATPSTFGKEFRVFESRISQQLQNLKRMTINAKLNGATGTYAAHAVAYPKIDWIAFTQKFIDGLNTKKNYILLIPNLVTTQIEPHDTYAEIFDACRRINVIALDCAQDMWRYISDGWLVQKKVSGEIGSSAMPHKVNPIQFENAEGNLGIGNALFTHFSTKLPVSRLQRDLSDSTVMRSVGTAFSHSVLAFTSLIKGFSRAEVNTILVETVLTEHVEVIAEALQTVLKREGISNAYEQLKELTRGETMTLERISTFIHTLPVSQKVKNELLAITPVTYIGLAEKIAKSKFKN